MLELRPMSDPLSIPDDKRAGSGRLSLRYSGPLLVGLDHHRGRSHSKCPV